MPTAPKAKLRPRRLLVTLITASLLGALFTLPSNFPAQVVVGRHDARSRLQRFARVLPQLVAAQKAPITRADLRYTNGFTLSWGEAKASGKQDRT